MSDGLAVPPSLPAPGELLALSARFASSLSGKDVVSQELGSCDSGQPRATCSWGMWRSSSDSASPFQV